MSFEAPFSHSDVRIDNTTLVYNGYYQLKTLTLAHRLFGGGWTPPLRRELLVREDSCGVLLYDAQQQLLVLVEQFRPGVLQRGEQSPWTIELVAGSKNTNESSAATIKRETWEEVGCQVTELELISRCFASPGTSNERFEIFCGRVNAAEAGYNTQTDNHEDTRAFVIPANDVTHLLDSSERHISAPTALALLWFMWQRERLTQQWT